MKEAVVRAGPKVEIRDVPIPKPGPHQVVIKIEYSGSNPKDWKLPDWFPDAEPVNQGDDMAGTIYEVGEGVTEFKKGDRVAAYHEPRTPGGSYAEYGLACDHTTFILSENTSFAAGAAIPLAALTAALSLFGNDNLNLPAQPWSAATEPVPLVIYGASSAVGSYALQLAVRSNIHPIIAVAGRAQAHVEALIDRSRGDTVIDYREGDVAQAIKQALKGVKLNYAYDAVSEHGSYQAICRSLDPHGKITLVLPGKKYAEIPDTVQKSVTSVGHAHSTKKDLAYVSLRCIARGLEQGWFKAQPQEVVPNGLAGIEVGLRKLKQGNASALKYVFNILDTPGLSSLVGLQAS